MTIPRRAAALAVCLLAMAAGAAAQACNTFEGSFTMELVSVTGAGTDSSQISKCLSHVRVNLGADCNVKLDSLSAGGSFLPSIFTDSSLETLTYDQFKECPASSAGTGTSATATPTVTGSFTGPGGLSTALLTEMKKFAYQGSRDYTVLTHIKVADGVVTVQNAPSSPTVVFKYAIKERQGMTNTNVVVATGTDMAAGTEYQTVIGNQCSTGRYGQVVGSIKICFMCPSGTWGSGNGCTACAAGTSSAIVGQTAAASCAACSAGTYAHAGSSNCLPCTAGTYSGGSAAQCTDCPVGSYSWIPGSAGCYKCFNGVPECVAGKEGTTDCSDSDTTRDPTPGFQVLDVTQLATWPAALTGAYKPSLYDKCSSWAGTPTLKLALEVAGDCSITIRPITDLSCSDEGASNTVSALVPRASNGNGVVSGKYTYTYNDLAIRAYYQTTTTIRSLLPTDSTNPVDSFLLAIDQSADSGYDQTKDLKLRLWAASDNPATTPPSNVADNKVTVVGGRVAGLPTNAIDGSSCPAGTYASADNYCSPCPQGHYCPGSTADPPTPCSAGTANPFLGASVDTACATCNSGTSGLTSVAGSAYCTVPYFERNCPTGGEYFEESSMQCEKCPAGTARAPGDATNLECTPCGPGTYSGVGAATCTPCPAGQYNPSEGLADQSTTAEPKLHCLRCPLGSVALTSTEAAASKFKTDNSLLTSTDDYRNDKALPGGATTCMACPDGTYAFQANTEKAPTGTEGSYTNTATSCTLCPYRTYRTGDASPENNECKPIPHGYKAKSTLVGATAVGSLQCTASTTTTCVGAYEIEACGKGTVSSWDLGFTTRTPAEPLKCQACTLNLHAPRSGMAKCIPCRGGSRPATSGSSAGPDTCIACDAGYFRGIATPSATCTSCSAGSEVGSGRQECTPCRAGFFKADGGSVDSKDFCSRCPRHTYATRIGATACANCPKGTETQGEGNSKCTACSLGYYKKADGNTGCVAAEPGTFVNTTGAIATTPCPLGTFNDQDGQDTCDPCAPGQYANARGSQSCKTCPAGTFSNSQAATCTSCKAGFFAPAGSRVCSPCKPGTFASSARSQTCAACPAGKQCPTPATNTPQNCPAGTFSASGGAVLCTPCPVNFFQSTTGQTRCTACSAGTNTRGLTGQRACQAVRVSGLRRSVL